MSSDRHPTCGTRPEPVIRVREHRGGLRRAPILKGLDLECTGGEILGFVGRLGAGQVGADPGRCSASIPKRAGTIEVFGQNLDDLSTKRTRVARASLGRAVSAGRPVLGADREAEHPGADARVSGPLRPAPGRARDAEDRDGGPEAGRGGQASLRALGRHDQARCSGPARSRSTPRSCSSTSRPPGSTPSARASSTSSSRQCSGLWAYRIHGNPRSGQSSHGLRPHRRAR